jgi:aminoglycoside phosphotransferase (APT) family kinase protein
VSAALPEAAIVSAAALSTGEGGRYDSAIVGLDDGSYVVVRAPVDASAASDLATEALALRALTPGARALLPFAAPRPVGEVALAEGRALVTDMVPGYRVEAADLPAGPGAATSVGIALAALHALPASVVRAEGLPVKTAEEVRESIVALVERAASTRRLPVALATRWRRAAEDEALWRFDPCVVLGDAVAASFRYEDRGGVPVVSGVLGWSRFSVGDPAADLQWLAAAPDAADDVYAAYVSAAHRSPDPDLRTRARLYAELEFAKWLLHGHDQRDEAVVGDAVALLEALVDGLGDTATRLDPVAAVGVDDAMAVLADTPVTRASAEDDGSISMQTDTYDPEMVSLFVAAAREHETGEAPSATSERFDHVPPAATPASAGASPAASPSVPTTVSGSEMETAPIDVGSWSDLRQLGDSRGTARSADTAGVAAGSRPSATVPSASDRSDPDASDRDASAPDGSDPDEVIEAARASRAAFQRWARSASE